MLAPNMSASSARAVLSHPNLNMVRRLVIPLFLLMLVASTGIGADEKKEPAIEWREWSNDIFAQAKNKIALFCSILARSGATGAT
jgi:hypothetical protein